MDATTMKAECRVPECFAMAKSLERQAYEMAWEKGRLLAVEYMDRGAVVNGGAFPVAPPEFQGRWLAEMAWKTGCVDGAAAAAKVQRDAFRADLLSDAREIVDELEAADDEARPHVVGAALKSPAQIQNEQRAEWLKEDEARRESERLQALIDADFAQMESRVNVGASVVAGGVIAIVAAALALTALLLLSGCAQRLPSFHGM